jgi:hypothetical protein
MPGGHHARVGRPGRLTAPETNVKANEVYPGSLCLPGGAVRYCSTRPGPWRPLLPSGCAAPLQLRHRQPPLSPLTAWGQGRGPVLTACCSHGLRMVFAWSSLWFRYGLRGFCGLPASPVPRCLPQAAHHSPPYYRDAAAPRTVTALWRRRFPLRPAKGLPGDPLPTEGPTSRMNRCFPVGGSAEIQNDFLPNGA